MYSVLAVVEYEAKSDSSNISIQASLSKGPIQPCRACKMLVYVRKSSNKCKGLVTNYGEGGLQNGRGGHMKFYPYEKGGREKF